METMHHVMLGTRNTAKIEGVAAAFGDLADVLVFPPLEIPDAWTCQVESGVSDEPWGFPATIAGAQNRARAARATLLERLGALQPDGVAIGLGVESGFVEVDPTMFTLHNFDVCALFDGHHVYVGISPGFEYPRRLVRNIFLHRQPFQDARQYITTEADVERRRGIIGVLAAGLTDRPEMTRWAARLALIRYLRRHDYCRWQ